MTTPVSIADIVGTNDEATPDITPDAASPISTSKKSTKTSKATTDVAAEILPVTVEKTVEEIAQPAPQAEMPVQAAEPVAEKKDSKDIPVEPVRPRRSSESASTRAPMRPMRDARSRDSRDSRDSRGRDSRPMRDSRDNRDNRSNREMLDDRFAGVVDDRMIPDADAHTEIITGILDTSTDGHGVLRAKFTPSEGDAYISSSQIRRFKLRPGDIITGPARAPKENERYWGLLKVDTVNGKLPEEIGERVKFQSLVPVYPDEQIKLETGEEPLSTRIIDMVAPIGKGQRSLIVSPPKAGKTTLLMDIGTGIAANYPDIHLMAVLVGERPEEVTDFRRHIAHITKEKGEVAASNFDESAEDQCRVAELALERAKRLVEEGRDVVILLDSITRLARAYNLSIPTSGRTLSGGFDPAALFPPKKFFGAARNFEGNGSLTIIGTSLVDTGSRMDDLVYEEFKGTGNQEVHLDRRLAERRIYPAIDVQKSGTRKDNLLIEQITYQSILTLQRMLDMVDKDDRTQTLIEQMKRHSTNSKFLASLKAG